MNVREAELTVLVGSGSLLALPDPAAVLHGRRHQLYPKIFQRLAVLTGDAAADAARLNQLQHNRRTVWFDHHTGWCTNNPRSLPAGIAGLRHRQIGDALEIAQFKVTVVISENSLPARLNQR